MVRPIADPRFVPGDIVVAPAPGGNYQIARVAANGRTEHVLGQQRDCLSALKTACRATSGRQRVFVWADDDAVEYRMHECD